MESLAEETKERILKNRRAALEIQNNLKSTLSNSYTNKESLCANTAVGIVNDPKKEVLQCLQMVSCQDYKGKDDTEADLHLSNSFSTSKTSLRVCANLLQTESEIVIHTSFNEQCCKSCQIRLRPDFETICKATVSSEYLLPEVQNRFLNIF